MSQFSTLLKQLKFAATDAMFNARVRNDYPDAVPGSMATQRHERQHEDVRLVQRWAVPHPLLDGLVLSHRRPGPGARLLSLAIVGRARVGRFLPSEVFLAMQDAGGIRVG